MYHVFARGALAPYTPLLLFAALYNLLAYTSQLGDASPALHSLIATLLLTAYFLLLLPSGTCWEYQLALPFFCGFHFLLLWFVICSVGVCRFRCSLQWLKDNAVSQVCVQLQIQFSAWIVAAWWGRAGFSFFVSVDDDVWCVISWFCHLQMLLLLLSPWFVLFSQSPCVGLSKPACTDKYYLASPKSDIAISVSNSTSGANRLSSFFSF